MAMEPKPDGKDNSPISTSSWRNTACNTQGAKTAPLCTAAIAKSTGENNSVKRIMAIGAAVDI